MIFVKIYGLHSKSHMWFTSLHPEGLMWIAGLHSKSHMKFAFRYLIVFSEQKRVFLSVPILLIFISYFIFFDGMLILAIFALTKKDLRTWWLRTCRSVAIKWLRWIASIVLLLEASQHHGVLLSLHWIMLDMRWQAWIVVEIILWIRG